MGVDQPGGEDRRMEICGRPGGDTGNAAVPDLYYTAFLPAARGQQALCADQAVQNNHPFKEPIMTPLTKYFCRKG